MTIIVLAYPSWCTRSYNGELNKRSVSFGLCIIMHVEQSDYEWPQPMCTKVERYITLINDSKTLGEHFQLFSRNKRGPCDIMSAFTIVHMRQWHSVFVLVIRKRPGLKSFDAFKTFLKLPERSWYNIRKKRLSIQ